MKKRVLSVVGFGAFSSPPSGRAPFYLTRIFAAGGALLLLLLCLLPGGHAYGTYGLEVEGLEPIYWYGPYNVTGLNLSIIVTFDGYNMIPQTFYLDATISDGNYTLTPDHYEITESGQYVFDMSYEPGPHETWVFTPILRIVYHIEPSGQSSPEATQAIEVYDGNFLAQEDAPSLVEITPLPPPDTVDLSSIIIIASIIAIVAVLITWKFDAMEKLNKWRIGK